MVLSSVVGRAARGGRGRAKGPHRPHGAFGPGEALAEPVALPDALELEGLGDALAKYGVSGLSCGTPVR